MHLYAYVGADPINNVDPAGLARIFSQTAGSRARSVMVDGNGDGNSRDNDLNPSQTRAFGRDFTGFINENSGSDIGNAGVNNISGGSEDQQVMARVTSQFIGAATQRGSNWRSVTGIVITDSGGMARAKFGPGRTAGQVAGDDRGYADIWGSGNIFLNSDHRGQFNRPSWLARTLLHERNHFSHRGADLFGGLHGRIDANARNLLNGMGLGGGGCEHIDSASPGCGN
jgi:hypothetical protein